MSWWHDREVVVRRFGDAGVMVRVLSWRYEVHREVLILQKNYRKYTHDNTESQKIACGDFFRLARIHAKETRKFVELSTIGESLETS